MHALLLAIATLLLASLPVRLSAQCAQCQGDFNNDSFVTVDEIIIAVNNVLSGCPAVGARFTDKGDGTISDSKTGLQWEKKSNDGSVHDQGIQYSWSADAQGEPDGTLFTEFLATLNHEPCFAGHCDWRVPSLSELQSLVDYADGIPPAVNSVFDSDCDPDSQCTVLQCSCTYLDFYWSSTPLAELPHGNAWNVDFNWGSVSIYEKTLPAFYARAVRSGS